MFSPFSLQELSSLCFFPTWFRYLFLLIVKSSVSQSISSQGSSSGSNFEMRRSMKGLYNPMHRNSSGKEIPGSTQFSLPQIQKATKNFSPNLKIGQGGSGTVYKGQLNDGTLIAVKRAKKVCSYFLMFILQTALAIEY